MITELAAEHGQDEIAARLYVSRNTVKTQIRGLSAKVSVT